MFSSLPLFCGSYWEKRWFRLRGKDTAVHLCAYPSAARGELHLIWRAESGDNHTSFCEMECFQKKLQTFTGVLRSVKGGFNMKKGGWGGGGGEWEGNKRLTSSYNQSHLFPTINQLFSAPQVPHFPLPNSFHKLRCAWTTLLFWFSQIKPFHYISWSAIFHHIS